MTPFKNWMYFVRSAVVEAVKQRTKNSQKYSYWSLKPESHFPAVKTFTVLVQPREHVHKSVLLPYDGKKKARLNTTEVSGKSHFRTNEIELLPSASLPSVILAHVTFII